MFLKIYFRAKIQIPVYRYLSKLLQCRDIFLPPHSVLHIGLQPTDRLLREILAGTQLRQAFDGPAQPSVLEDRLGLVEVDVRMGLQLTERGLVDVDLVDIRCRHPEKPQRLVGKLAYLHQLTGMAEST